MSSTFPVWRSAMWTATTLSESEASSFGRTPNRMQNHPITVEMKFTRIPMPSRPSPTTSFTAPAQRLPITHPIALMISQRSQTRFLNQAQATQTTFETHVQTTQTRCETQTQALQNQLHGAQSQQRL